MGASKFPRAPSGHSARVIFSLSVAVVCMTAVVSEVIVRLAAIDVGNDVEVKIVERVVVVVLYDESVTVVLVEVMLVNDSAMLVEVMLVDDGTMLVEVIVVDDCVMLVEVAVPDDCVVKIMLVVEEDIVVVEIRVELVADVAVGLNKHSKHVTGQLCVINISPHADRGMPSQNASSRHSF